MKIVVDENIPLAVELFGQHGELSLVPGRQIDSTTVKDADALIVRSVTAVNKSLLEGSKVRFVGSATIGKDHIDESWLAENKIGFTSAPGCNAISVAEYVVAALMEVLAAASSGDVEAFNLSEKSVAVIGYGNVGKAVAKKLNPLVRSVMACDPLVAEQSSLDVREGGSLEFDHQLVSLEVALQQDIICLHTPLTTQGSYPTLSMIGAKEIASLAPGTVLLNAGRGGVVDEASLLERINNCGDLRVVFDVWESEPNINPTLLEKVFLGTPHIAGYSLQGKQQGTQMVYEAFCNWFKLDGKAGGELNQGTSISVSGSASTSLIDSVRASYDIWQDHYDLQKGIAREDLGAYFDALRKGYRIRNEFRFFSVTESEAVDPQVQKVLKSLGFNLGAEKGKT